jgi:hypothetical protein
MLRFIMTILLMVACFFAGRLTAQENACPYIVKTIEQIEVTPQEILALTRNADLQTQFPDLYHQLMVLVASPQVQTELVNPDRSSSLIYQKLADLVILINSRLQTI